MKTLRQGLIPFWFLNDGSTVSEKMDTLRACRAGGITGLAMHCRGGNLVPYASTEWFEMIRALVEEGKRLDMDMWLYDEDPYPSGAAGGMVMTERPDLCAQSLVLHEKPESLRPGDLWLIGEDRIVWAGGVPVKKMRPPEALTGRVGTVRADWFSGRWDSRHYYPETPRVACPRGGAIRQQFAMRVPAIPPGYKLVAIAAEKPGSEGPWGALPDLLNPETFPRFRKLTLDRYKEFVGEHFGRTVPGIFTDEAKAHGAFPVTGDLFEAFRATFGYDLRSRLYQLFGEPLSEEFLKTRMDYRSWVGERFMEAFVRPYRQYCDRNHLLLTGHFSPEDDPIAEATTVVSVMPIMKELSLPGTDIIVPLVGDRRAPILNLGSVRVGSLKAQWGHPYAISETQALADWTAVSRKGRQIYAWQMVLGVDRFFTHGFFNSNEGVVNYEAPPDYGPSSPLFRGTCAINRWLGEIGACTDGGVDAADTLIVNSMEPFWTGSPGEDDARLREERHALWQTVLSGLRRHVGIHVADAADLAKAEVCPGKLKVGARTYGTVLAPDVDGVSAGAFTVLERARAAGVRVCWFGGGPEFLRDEATGALKKCPPPSGDVFSAGWPDEAWYRDRLSPQALLSGRGAADCYVRRFVGKDGRTRLLAVNLSEKDRALSLGVEKDGGWLPVCVDGDAVATAQKTSWRLPGMGVGLFELGDPPPAPSRPAGREELRRETGRNRRFSRTAPNLLRLNTPRVVLGREVDQVLREPKPYWQISDNYSARRVLSQFLGEVPVESRVRERDLRYLFVFQVAGEVAPRLVLDPRCARGTFRIRLNGRPLGGRRVFPIDGQKKVRKIPLKKLLKEGRNRLELRFDADSAMDGLLSQLYLEGAFEVGFTRGGVPRLAPERRAVSEKGWQVSGLPHYMGDGIYDWTERFSKGDLAYAWRLELEEVVDSAELFLNGESMGTRAWREWRWKLPALKPGTNRFRLVVSGTAGNKHGLDEPAQPQGWIGKGTLVGTTDNA